MSLFTGNTTTRVPAPTADLSSLWGNPQHLWYLRTALEEKYKDRLHIIVAARNSYTYTYDGIEVGAERVAQEIEDEFERLEREGTHIKKLSIVGYSLGGLIARYTIGLLLSRGWFDKLEPVNFTTFASPHLGVRAPLRGYHTKAWNWIAARTLSESGRQLFLIDSFRDDGRPLLSILADPNSIFIKALRRFKNRTLYANITNDRSAPYFTTYIAGTDPYIDMEAIQTNPIKGYEPTVLNPDQPFKTADFSEELSLYSRITSKSSVLLTNLPLYAMLAVLVPLGTVTFLVNAGYQNLRSSQRIYLHETGKAGVGFKNYRIPLLIENARAAVEGAIENMTGNEPQEYLSDSEQPRNGDTGSKVDEKATPNARSTTTNVTPASSSHFPTLALAPEQFQMIEALDKVGFRKYPVHIQKVRHSHAAIIVRTTRKGFDEGKVVVRHWLDREFEI